MEHAQSKGFALLITENVEGSFCTKKCLSLCVSRIGYQKRMSWNSHALCCPCDFVFWEGGPSLMEQMNRWFIYSFTHSSSIFEYLLWSRCRGQNRSGWNNTRSLVALVTFPLLGHSIWSPQQNRKVYFGSWWAGLKSGDRPQRVMAEEWCPTKDSQKAERKEKLGTRTHSSRSPLSGYLQSASPPKAHSAMISSADEYSVPMIQATSIHMTLEGTFAI